MDKLTMAHEVACAMINNGCSMHTAIADAWRYADAMQAEAEKRLNVSTNDFQIDWSQAPKGANWWVMDADGSASWFISKPSSDAGYWDVNDNSSVYLAPSFNYKGAWQDSLHKRPQDDNQ